MTLLYKTCFLHVEDQTGLEAMLTGSGEVPEKALSLRLVIKWVSYRLIFEMQVADKAGLVSVKWDNGNFGYYRFDTLLRANFIVLQDGGRGQI